MKNLKTATGYVLMLMLLAFVNGCTKDDDGGGNGSPTGVWQRYGSPNGYNTDLAIGNIPGEPSNRVYMCEHTGSPSAGLYKGTISGNTITWDATHGLPDADFDEIGNGERSLYFGVGALADAGKYKRGIWTEECGELKKTTAACQYTQWTGTGNCGSGNYSVYTSKCCGASYPFYCAVTNKCYTNCEDAEAACSSTVYKANSGSGGSAGYNCVSGSCSYVSSGASYSTLSSCQSSCGSSGGGTGQFMAWTSVPEYGFPNGWNVMQMSVSGKSGTISGGHYTSAPSCGATYCFNGSLSPGQYTITGKITFLKLLDGTTPAPYTTSKSITIYANQCTTVHFQ